MNPTPQVIERRLRFSLDHVERLVDEFYTRVRSDEVLGPIFEHRVTDWPLHLERMVLFWRAVLRSEPTFTMSPRGGPAALHRAISELGHEHFERWLEVFGEVVDAIFEPRTGVEVKLAAERIADSLARHIPAGSTGNLG